MRCGKTPKTSPTAKPPSWPGSPRPTPACIAPICSKRACGTYFRSKARKASRPWTGGSPGARRCRIPVFVELAGRIVRHRQAIDAALDHGLSQGLIESTNTKIRLLTRIAFGFRSPEALIALAMLALGGHRPALPGRTKHPRIGQ